MGEIAELSPSIQAKLLRVLQERGLRRVGGRSVTPVSIRLIAATNQDLSESLAISNSRIPQTGYRESVANSRRRALQEAIEHAGGNLKQAAKLLGVHRNYVYRLMRGLGLRPATGNAEVVSG